MNKHTTARKGKRVHIILKDGTQFVDKLVEIKSRFYEFETKGRIMRKRHQVVFDRNSEMKMKPPPVQSKTVDV